ncbi:MAG: aminotransferase class V-fold PLP-dependent enzyme [Acetatifactor sp.]
MIYFDQAATTRVKPDPVVRAVTEAMCHMGNSGRAVHGSALDASRVIFEAREKAAAFFGCPKARNVVFTSNATESLNIALFGLLGPGDHVIATDLEHNSVLRPLYHLERQGVEVSFLTADSKGNVCPEQLQELVRPNTKVIVCTHASNLTGNLIDIAAVGSFAKERGLIFVVDASQTAGLFPLDMGKLGIDVLCFTGHKALLGPQGIGGMCIGERIEIRPLKMGGTGVQTYLAEQPKEYPTRLEAGTLNGHGIAGLAAGIDYILQIGMDARREQEQRLMRRFYEGVLRMEGIKVYGDFSGERAPIVALNWRDVPSTELADALWEEACIATRAGAHCAPRMHRALGTVEQGAVRFSFGYENTEEEVEVALAVLRRLCV